MTGTGNAWAWHVSANAEPPGVRTPIVTAPVANDGARDPTGSIYKVIFFLFSQFSLSAAC